MKTLFIVAVVVECSLACKEPGGFVLRKIEQTNQIELTGGFLFSVSPNNRWLVFFGAEDIDPDPKPDTHYLYGRLRVLDIESGKVYPFTLREGQVTDSMSENIQALWSNDSAMCVLPPPPVKSKRVVIRISEGKAPSLAFMPEHQRPIRPGETVPEAIDLPENLTSSDCSRRSDADDLALMKKVVPPEFWFLAEPTAQATNHGTQAVSHDGKKVYYQRGPQVNARDPAAPVNLETTLHEIDATTGKDRMLVSHAGNCAAIEYLRPSPDGRRLAYTVTAGCGFGGTPEIFVLDLASGKTEMIALGSGRLRWSSTSDKLYFYRRWEQGDHGHFLWVAEFAPAQPAKTPAASNPTRPATQPGVK